MTSTWIFDIICNLPVSSDVFCQAIHPTEPYVAVGLAAGHVQAFKLPPVASDDTSDDAATASENGYGQIETEWRTRRHKGSCRSLAFSCDGKTLYSAGTDGLVKCAASETGKVGAKFAIPLDPKTSTIDAPTVIHELSPQTLLLATDSSALHLYDTRSNLLNAKPQQTFNPHDDYISSLTPIPPTEASTSGFSKQWVTTGGTTIAVTDVRKGVLVKSEDQEEELLCSAFVDGLAKKGSSRGEKLVVGGAGGVLTLWEKGVWDDQDDRITIDRSASGGESLDAIVRVPDEAGAGSGVVAVGLGDGRVSFVKIGPNKVVGELRHDEAEGVVAMGFDVGGRLITGGGGTVKVWCEKTDRASESDDETDDEAGDDTKRRRASESDDDSEDEDSESSEEEQTRKRRKRRKRNKGKDRSSTQAVMSFKGLD